MPPEKHIFRAGDADPSGSLRRQGGKTVFRAGGGKGDRPVKKAAAPGKSDAPSQAAAPDQTPPAPSRPVKLRRGPGPGEQSARAPQPRQAARSPGAAPRPAARPAKRKAARRGPLLPLCILTGLLALLLVCFAGWALDLPGRLAALTGPAASSSAQAGQEWPAMVGDRMVSEKPAKVVSLSPMVTEALLSLPGHEALCAVTEYCDARSTSLPTVGTPLLPRTEEIIALAPDYVLCQTPLAGPVQTALEQAGVEVIQLDTPADLAGLRQFYGQLGALLGGNETDRALGYGVIDRLESTLARYDAALPEKATALLLPDLSGLAATADTAEWTLLGQVFRHPLPDAADWLAGAGCLTDEDGENDLDEIRAADPDVLLVADTVSPEELADALGDLRAVQNGAVVWLDLRLTETLSPRLVFAIADAAALAYPEFAAAS